MDKVTLYNDDCLTVMPKLGAGSIDLILCDLPYGITACHWDSIIPLDALWKEYKRIIKTDGNIVLTASQPFTSMLVSSNYEMFRYEWIWEKPQGTNPLHAKYAPLKNHENILVFSKKRGRYFPQMEVGTPYAGFSSDDKTIGEAYGSLKSVHKQNDGTRYPKTVQKFSQTRNRVHPTQKPVDLMEYLIKTYTAEGDVVLDNCMGSGTTGVAAMNTGRTFIGIELDPLYFGVAENRIDRAELFS